MVDPTDGLQHAIGQGYSALDAQAHRSRLDGFAVVSGLTPSAGASGLEVDVASGSAVVGTDGNGDPVTVSNGGTTVTLANADSTNPRKDTVYIDSAGSIQVAQGVAEAAAPSGNDRFDTFSPEPPLINDATVLAEVWVGAGVTSLSSADVRDRRQPAQIVGEEVAAETLRAATLGRSVDASGNDITGIGALGAGTLASALDANGNDITGIGQAEADSVSTDSLNIGSIDTASDDAELDDALSNAQQGAVIYLTDESNIQSDRMITTRGITIIGTGTTADTNFIGGANWTIDSREVDIASISMNDTSSLTFNSIRGAVYGCQFFAGTNITVNADSFRFVNNQSGDVTFASGTDSSIVDACVKTTVTDNGANTVADIG